MLAGIIQRRALTIRPITIARKTPIFIALPTMTDSAFGRTLMENKTSRKDALKRVAQLSLGIGFVIGAVDKVAGEIPSPSGKENGATISQASALQQHPLTRATYYTSLVYDSCNSYDSGYTSYSVQNYSRDHYCQTNSYFYATTCYGDDC
jgi:hypothetical protein